jgi:hypothetical protein
MFKALKRNTMSVVTDYIQTSAKFGANELLLREGYEKKNYVNIQSLIDEIVALEKGEAHRLKVTKFSEENSRWILIGFVAVLVVIGLVTDRFFGGSHVIQISAVAVLLSIALALAHYEDRCVKMNSRLVRLRRDLAGVTANYFTIGYIMKGTVLPPDKFIEYWLSRAALGIITMEKSLPADYKGPDPKQLADAKENTRAVARAFEKFDLTDGKLDPYFAQAKKEWAKLASMMLVGIDYVI